MLNNFIVLIIYIYNVIEFNYLKCITFSSTKYTKELRFRQIRMKLHSVIGDPAVIHRIE